MGPQLKAIEAGCVIDELLFGGARGGSKTDFLIGDFAADLKQGSDWHGVLFRRSYPQLDEIIRRTLEVYPQLGGDYKVGAHEWHWSNGAKLSLRHLDTDADIAQYQGHSFCVAEGTPVLMADGTYRCIEEIQVGDSVQTLEGAREVQATHDVGEKSCVAVYRDGELLQMQPFNHALLTTSSWQSFSSLQDNDAIATLRTSQGSASLPCVGFVAALKERDPVSSGQRSLHYDESSTELSASDISRRLSAATNSFWKQSPSRSGHSQQHLSALRRLWIDCSASPSISDDGAYEQLDLEIGSDFQSVDQSGLHLCDEPLPCRSESGLDGAPLPGDVAVHGHEDYTPDGPDSIPKCNQSGLLPYVHPYTQEPRLSLLQTSSVALSFAPCGYRRVFDLTVADVNHYITTNANIVNKNSWIGWDEITHWPSNYAYNALKATLRGPAQHKRIRTTGNPGGRGHLWVREYFVDQTDGGTKVHVDPETAMSRAYVPSRVTDNKILLQQDPGYIQRLKGVGDPALVAAWLSGDWDAIVGGYFSHLKKDECEVDPMAIPPEWPLFLCMDYGEANPTWCGILAVDYDDNIYVVDEYYRAETGGADHARGIRNMVDTCPFIIGHPQPRAFLAPSDMWIKRAPGEKNLAWSPADSFREAGFFLSKCNMDRINGWRAINDLLREGRLKFFKGRTSRVIASLLSVQHDPNHPEDVEKGGDDHAADGIRYGINHVYKPRKTAPVPGEGTGQALLDMLETAKRDGRYG